MSKFPLFPGNIRLPKPPAPKQLSMDDMRKALGRSPQGTPYEPVGKATPPKMPKEK